MTILQTNLGRNRAAHDAAFATATEIDADIIVVSEPNKNICNGRGWYADTAKDVAVYIRNNRICIQKIQKFEGHLTIEFPSFTLFSVYLSPNITREDYSDKLQNIMEKARRCQSEKIIAGDFNAKSAEWGSPTTDARGTILMDWTSTLNLIVQNRGANLPSREITRKRRNRNTNARDIEEAEDLYKTAKKELRNLINESKKKCWQELLKDLENDVWGEGFKIVMKQHRSYVPYSLTRQSKAKAVIELFPCGTNINVRRGRDRPSTVYNRRGKNMPRDTEEQEGAWNRRDPSRNHKENWDGKAELAHEIP
ncbi:hypothetical protein JTB14_031497 [Gonioctena quinquepunctata]|nr:hypothetical protein JTB14_031497 [Gonioctena quinquepunctata]